MIVSGSWCPGLGLAGKTLITRVSFGLSKWCKPVLAYVLVIKKTAQSTLTLPDTLQSDEWTCEIRRAKLRASALIGDASSFFRNPTVPPRQCVAVIQPEPRIAHYLLADDEVITLIKVKQTSVYQRFGILQEPEPVVV